MGACPSASTHALACCAQSTTSGWHWSACFSTSRIRNSSHSRYCFALRRLPALVREVLLVVVPVSRSKSMVRGARPIFLRLLSFHCLQVKSAGVSGRSLRLP